MAWEKNHTTKNSSGSLFHGKHGSYTKMTFFIADGETFLQICFPVEAGSMVQLENNFSYILIMTAYIDPFL